MSVTMQGRLFSRERLLTDGSNRKVTFYTISTEKGYYQVTPDKKIDMRKIAVPGLVEITVTSARERTNTAADGKVYKNTTVYAVDIKNIDSAPDFEEYEQRKLEDKLGL